MCSLPTTMQALHHPWRLYRQELQDRYPTLRFHPLVEREFQGFLRATQSRNLRFCIWTGLVLWLAAMVWDGVRYLHSIQGTPLEALYLQVMPAVRLLVLLALGSLMRGVRNRPWSRMVNVVAIATLVVYCIGTFVAGYVYSMLGVSNTTALSLLVLTVVLFPCGLTLREILPLGVALLAAYWFVVWLVLSAQEWSEFCAACGPLMLGMGLMVLGTYLRERSAREQFLLRRLLVWEASHDGLTGLDNRRSFERHGDLCLAQAARDGKTVLLALLDLDQFQQYNAYYGYAAGDRVLQQVALVLEDYAHRPLDMVARLGDEEFALLSYDDNEQALQQRMQHLLAQVQGLGTTREDSPPAPVLTASIGIARAASQETTHRLLQQAEEQLQRAKVRGRNQVCGPAVDGIAA